MLIASFPGTEGEEKERLVHTVHVLNRQYILLFLFLFVVEMDSLPQFGVSKGSLTKSFQGDSVVPKT